ncbi:ABC transporter ATP-binding protein [Cellulomonas telluris]|uniref:ABC transporter ATP-binding protein n=1 Tax=Cellulomonas telluris TaxID=2306636 RepID=UPI001FE6A5BE|nr:ABC transporter ATP-binding protein [Cellulomonas telluris]
MTRGPVLVTARGLTRVHGEGPSQVRAVAGVDLAVRAGELVAVMGPSGSGKTSLLRLLGGLDVPTSGRVTVAGQDLSELGPDDRARVRRRTVGYVFQQLNLVPLLTAAENVALPLELDGIRPRSARAAALGALADLGVADLADRFPRDLSGGQQQLVALARALVGERRVVLADEPTGALDSTTGDEVVRLLRARVDAGAAAVVVTHDARVAAWADRTVFLRDGVVTDVAEPGDPTDLLLGTPREASW